MRFYRITINEGDEAPSWHKKFQDAHSFMRTLTPYQDSARTELFDLPIDQDSILAILNGEPLGGTAVLGRGPLQTWRLSPRGGMTDTKNGE